MNFHLLICGLFLPRLELAGAQTSGYADGKGHSLPGKFVALRNATATDT